MKKYSMYKLSFLINKKDSKVILQNASRKKVRRLARRKYRKDYMITGKLVIISGNSIKEAIALYKAEKNKVVSKIKSSRKRILSVKIGKKDHKRIASLPTTMFEDLVKADDRQNRRINRKKAK